MGQAHGSARQGFAAQKHLYIHDAARLDGCGIIQQDDFQHLALRGLVQRVIGGRVEQAFGELFILAHRADFLALRFKLGAVALKHAFRGFAPYLGQAVAHQQGRGRVRQRDVAHKGGKRSVFGQGHGSGLALLHQLQVHAFGLFRFFADHEYMRSLGLHAGLLSGGRSGRVGLEDEFVRRSGQGCAQQSRKGQTAEDDGFCLMAKLLQKIHVRLLGKMLC